MDKKKEAILKAAQALTENYKKEELFMPKNGRRLPDRAAVIDLVKDLRSVIFQDISARTPRPVSFRSSSAPIV